MTTIYTCDGWGGRYRRRTACARPSMTGGLRGVAPLVRLRRASGFLPDADRPVAVHAVKPPSWSLEEKRVTKGDLGHERSSSKRDVRSRPPLLW